MHFYQKNIADFNNATRHLTRVERSLYSDAIELYYDTENPLISDFNKLARVLLAVTEEEKEALKNVLSEFFYETDDGFVNDRCEREIAKYRANTSAKARAGIASALSRQQKRTGVEQVLNISTTDEQLTNNYKPITSNHNNTLSPAIADDCPHNEILKLYAQHLPMLTQVRDWTEKRRKLLKARWRESKERQELPWWDELFSFIAKSDFLTGRSTAWQADIEWILNSSNLVKITEGKYENRTV